jgi:uncharacterized GH25 family protein
VKKIKSALAAGTAFSLLSLASPGVSSAHTLWINATDHSPAFSQKFGGEAKTYFGFGHRYPLDDYLSADHLSEYVLVSPDGTKTALVPDNPAGFLATRVQFPKAGQYVVAASTKPGFYTMYRENDEIRHKIGPKTGLGNVILSNYYEQYSKALFNVGASEGNAFGKPVGHRLEIVPVENPFTLKGNGGDTLTVKVLFNGQPARYCRVYATYGGFSVEDDFAYATTADGRGLAKIRLTHWGAWLIKANMKLPPTDDMKDKCNDMSYTSTLTMEIP